MVVLHFIMQHVILLSVIFQNVVAPHWYNKTKKYMAEYDSFLWLLVSAVDQPFLSVASDLSC
jgi:hypothetical protein